MSNKAIIGTVIVVVIIVGGAFLLMQHHSDVMAEQATAAANATPVPTTTGTGMSANSDDSNAALTQDMTSVDTQMNGLNSDNASADQGLNNPNQ